MKEEDRGCGGHSNCCDIATITQGPKALTSATEAVQYDD